MRQDDDHDSPRRRRGPAILAAAAGASVPDGRGHAGGLRDVVGAAEQLRHRGGELRRPRHRLAAHGARDPGLPRHRRDHRHPLHARTGARAVVAGPAGSSDGGDGVVPDAGRHHGHHAPQLDRLPLLRDGQPVAPAPVVHPRGGAAQAGAAAVGGLGRDAGLLRADRPAVGAAEPDLQRGLPRCRRLHGAGRDLCLLRLSALRGAEPAAEELRPAAALLALLPAAVHGRGRGGRSSSSSPAS
jgi:hypothetical protein